MRQCLILTDDPDYQTLLEVVTNQFGLRARITGFFDQLGELSSSLPTIAWIIDLDGITHDVEQVVLRAKQKAPDASMIFISSRFTAKLAQDCIKHGACALLLKPFPPTKLIQALISLHQEIELVEKTEMVSACQDDRDEKKGVVSHPPTKNSHLLRVDFSCPACLSKFEAIRFKTWMVPVCDMDTDFCPMTTGTEHPELYSVMVCPLCLFSTYVGQFSRFKIIETKRKQFLDAIPSEERKRASFNLNYTGERTLLHGSKSFELAAISIRQLEMRNGTKLEGEFFLKCSWLARKMGNPKEERQYQEKAFLCFAATYAPYRSVDGKFPTIQRVIPRLPKGFDPLNERAFLLSGFLAGEMARRLGQLEKAKWYFDEVLSHPALPQFTSLFQHMHVTNKLLLSQLKNA